MNRTEYLKLCQKVSMLSNNVCETIKDVPTELLVELDGINYYPVEFKITFRQGKQINVAILHDLNSPMIIRTSVERINYAKR